MRLEKPPIAIPEPIIINTIWKKLRTKYSNIFNPIKKFSVIPHRKYKTGTKISIVKSPDMSPTSTPVTTKGPFT